MGLINFKLTAVAVLPVGTKSDGIPGTSGNVRTLKQ